MKIALCLYGQPRALHNLQSLVNHVIEPFGISDIFIHTWFDTSFIGTPFKSSQFGQNGKLGSYQPNTMEILQGLNSLKLIAEPSIHYSHLDHLKSSHDVQIQQLASCFDSMKKSVDLAVEYGDYDLIIRTRFDVSYGCQLNISEIELNTVYVAKNYQDKCNSKMTSKSGIEYSVMTDFLVIGDPLSIRKSSVMFDNFENLHNDVQVLSGENFSGLSTNGYNGVKIQSRLQNYCIGRNLNSRKPAIGNNIPVKCPHCKTPFHISPLFDPVRGMGFYISK